MAMLNNQMVVLIFRVNSGRYFPASILDACQLVIIHGDPFKTNKLCLARLIFSDTNIVWR